MKTEFLEKAKFKGRKYEYLYSMNRKAYILGVLIFGLTIVSLLISSNVQAQNNNVGIGTNTPDASAILS